MVTTDVGIFHGMYGERKLVCEVNLRVVLDKHKKF